MAVAKRRRRQIAIDTHRFVWWFGEDVDNCLHIVSDDKRFNVRYSAEVHMHSISPFVDVLGPRFPGLPPRRVGWYRVRTPHWHNPSIITPQFVRKLVAWCHDGQAERQFYPLRADEHMLVCTMWDRGVPFFDSARAMRPAPADPR